jgi:hypothetical protein
VEPDEDRRMELYEEIQQDIFDNRFGIYVGLNEYAEAHNDSWQIDERTPTFGYIEYISDFYYVP